MKKSLGISLIFAAFFSQACQTAGVKYPYKGQWYSSKEEASLVQQTKINQALDSITPLNEPISNKNLNFGVVSFETMKNTIMSKFAGKTLTAADKLVIQYVVEKEYRGLMGMYESVKKSNIYKSVTLVITEGGELLPSKDNSVCFYQIKSKSNMPFYCANIENGKQKMTFDPESDESADIAKGLIQAFTAFAIQ